MRKSVYYLLFPMALIGCSGGGVVEVVGGGYYAAKYH